MKYPALLLLAGLSCATSLELDAGETASSSSSAEKDTETILLSAAELDQLLAPIALYPDPLVAIILPASTFPTEIVLAARFLKAKGDPDKIDQQPWDDSVKSLARYPDVVAWMDENLAWTQQMGAAFALQPAAMLTATQRLRSAAIKAGHLLTTPQQTVIVEREIVRIVPARREVIYVPIYDPVWIYQPYIVEVSRPRPGLTFSIGYRTGSWLSYDCDWAYQTVVVVHRPRRVVVWQTAPIWCEPRRDTVVYWDVWRPAPARVRSAWHEIPCRTEHPLRVAQPRINIHAQRPIEHRERSWDEARGARSRPPQRSEIGPSITRPDNSRRQESRIPERIESKAFVPSEETATRANLPRTLPASRLERTLPQADRSRSLPNPRERILREIDTPPLASPEPVFSPARPAPTLAFNDGLSSPPNEPRYRKFRPAREAPTHEPRFSRPEPLNPRVAQREQFREQAPAARAMTEHPTFARPDTAPERPSGWGRPAAAQTPEEETAAADQAPRAEDLKGFGRRAQPGERMR